MIKLDKKTLDEFIRITRKYISTGDTDILDKRRAIKNKLLNGISFPKNNVDDAIYELCVMKVSYSKIYEVLNILGFEVIENVG